MGKGLDTCLVVQKMALKSADPIEVDIAERKMKLMMLTPVDLDPQPRTGLSRQARYLDHIPFYLSNS
jgi:hypothetical protein